MSGNDRVAYVLGIFDATGSADDRKHFGDRSGQFRCRRGRHLRARSFREPDLARQIGTLHGTGRSLSPAAEVLFRLCASAVATCMRREWARPRSGSWMTQSRSEAAVQKPSYRRATTSVIGERHGPARTASSGLIVSVYYSYAINSIVGRPKGRYSRHAKLGFAERSHFF
jgi:hypothetical protein